MLDVEEFDRWRVSAEDALTAARTQSAAGMPQWSCFLCEQAAQLALKALLHAVGAGAWGHDLVVLGGAVAHALEEDLPPPVSGALRRLSRHYIPARYPDAHPSGSPGEHYGAEDAEEALADVGEIIRFVDDRWRDLRAGAES